MTQFIARNLPAEVDLLVIGGGVNGAGIARDAVGRGLTVMLLEQHDLAQHTSSASTKLIHGGLRYLEYYEFGLVRKALKERELLLAAAPHIMWPMRFVMPHDPSMRPALLIRIGLFLYDHLAHRRFLSGSFGIDLRRHQAGEPLKGQWRRGFEYSDGWVDDARLVALNACDASERGATILTRTRCLSGHRKARTWDVEFQVEGEPLTRRVAARAIVNAAGPWVASVLGDTLSTQSKHSIRLVKGSHIVVPRLFEHPYAYIFQNLDRRIMFAIPYEEDFTLIGTTDLDYQGDRGEVIIDSTEVTYLCDMANRYFRKQIAAHDVIRSYSGVRPLLHDDRSEAAAVTRDYWLELNTEKAPLLSVFGGKITTFRRLAEEAMDLLLPTLGVSAAMRRHWTATTPLPGGDFDGLDYEGFVARLQGTHPWLPVPVARRYVRAYGSRVTRIIKEASSLSGLGVEIAPSLFEAELEYLVKEEWVRTVDDALWRRSKLGLHLSSEEQIRVRTWLEARLRGGDAGAQSLQTEELVQHQIR
jgi:glycerol-3-phosphate dehydrogenase